MVNSSISRVISRLRFPLMVGVVFIHSKSIFIKPEMPLLSNIATFFSSILPSFCVPLFFTFSGYLFFASTPNLTPSDYGRKLKKRFRTLAVPYLFWNSLTIAALWITGRLVPSIANPVFETASSTLSPELLKCFYCLSDGFPIAYQFWFVRDLMIAIVFSPIVYLIVKKTPIGIICLTISYFILPHMTAWYFFSLGAYFAVQQRDFIALSNKLFKYAVVIGILSLITLIAIGNIFKAAELYIISSMIVVVAVAAKCSSHCGKYCRFFSKYCRTVWQYTGGRYDPSFFLFCYHTLPLMVIKKISSSFLADKSEWLWIVDYFFNPIIVIIIGVVLYKYLYKYTPRLLSFITGGR